MGHHLPDGRQVCVGERLVGQLGAALALGPDGVRGGQDSQRLGPQRGGLGGPALQDAIPEGPHLGGAALVGGGEEGEEEANRVVGPGVVGDAPVEGGAEVADVLDHPADELGRPARDPVTQDRVRLARQDLGEALVRFLPTPLGPKGISRVVADELQKAVARPRPRRFGDHEGSIDELGDEIHREQPVVSIGGRDGVSEIEVEGSRQRTQPVEEGPPGLVEQVDRHIDGGPHAPVPLRSPGLARAQHVEALVEQREELDGGDGSCS